MKSNEKENETSKQRQHQYLRNGGMKK